MTPLMLCLLWVCHVCCVGAVWSYPLTGGGGNVTTLVQSSQGTVFQGALDASGSFYWIERWTDCLVHRRSAFDDNTCLAVSSTPGNTDNTNMVSFALSFA